MASNKLFYIPGQLITVKCEESTILCRVTKKTSSSTCKECEEVNGNSISKEICGNFDCIRLGINAYPKLVKRCKKQT